MITLVLALYAEGRTDERFLPIIIQRAVIDLLSHRGRRQVYVLDPISIDGDINHRFDRRTDCVLEAARRARGYHALIIHADADYSTRERAMHERILPGIRAARAAGDDACTELIPLIPVRMVEAWMLADPDALCQVIGTDRRARALGIPAHPRQVESEPDPKGRLRQIIQTALASRPRRHRKLRIGELYEPLARQIRLERLQAVPAYRQFVIDLAQTLARLGLIEDQYE